MGFVLFNVYFYVVYCYSLFVLFRSVGVHLNSCSYAYHMRLIVQQTPILLELRHVKYPYPDKVPVQCFRQFPRGKTMLHINT